jgi:ABC-type transport system substrate-binding protein
LSNALVRLSTAIEEIRAAHEVLMRGDTAISEEVGRVREDAEQVLRIGDGLSRTVEQLGHEAASLESEVFRFKLPVPSRGGLLRVGLHQTASLRVAQRLDPLFCLENQYVEVISCVFSGLLRLEDGLLLPDLAERWEVDPSARRYRFFLRRNVTFHDGSAFTATDVKRHFERLLDPAMKSPDRGLLEDVEGVPEYTEGSTREVSGLQVLNEYTLEIRLREPKAFFLHLVAMPATAVARLDSTGRALGTGPFRLEHLGKDRITLERNPTYWRTGEPLLDRLELHLCASREAALTRLQEGELDLVSYLYASHVEGAEAAGHQVVASTTPSTTFLGFNVKEAPFHDARVRQAIRAGLDIPGVVQRFHTGSRVARSLTPPELIGEETLPALPHPDVALAERLLREAGMTKVQVHLLHESENDTTAEDTLLFKPLVDAGLVELHHTVLRSEEYLERRREGRLSVCRVGWIADIPDPDNFLYFLLNSHAQTVVSLGYRNEELDRLTSDARVTMDPERRKHLYRRAEGLVHHDCPIVPLFHQRVYAAATARVQSLRLHQTPPQVRLEDLWLETPAAASAEDAHDTGKSAA